MDNSEICFLTISEAAKLVMEKKISPVELVDAHLQRIDSTAGKLNSFITLLAEESRSAARDAEKLVQSGGDVGSLPGIPIGLKDLYYTKGVATTIGSKIMRDFVPDYDATVTGRFKKAGAIIVGKLQMHEFALGSTSENPHDGPAHNPWNLERVTGGSSGGSGAAVASGQVMGALGSDTGGSVRIPAALCGIVGLKPTFGLVSRYGVYPLSWSLDTVGPMTRTVTDAALIMNVIAGPDSRDPSSASRPDEDFTARLGRDIRGIRIGIPQEYFYDIIDPEVEKAIADAARILEGLGAVVDEVSIPALNDSIPISSTILLTEAAEIHLDNLRHRADDLGPDVRARLESGAMTPAISYIKAQRARTAFNREVSKAMGRFDVLMAPAVAVGAPELSEPIVKIGNRTEHKLAILPRLTRPFNITGTPAVSVPCGFTSDGLPIGLQLAGRAFEDSTVLQVAHAYEQATDWHLRRPSI